MGGLDQLPQVVGAASAAGRLPSRLHRRQEQASEHAHDPEDDQQLDQGEPGVAPNADTGAKG